MSGKASIKPSMGNIVLNRLKTTANQLAIPLIALGVLLLFNLRCCFVAKTPDGRPDFTRLNFANPDFSFFKISLATDERGSVLTGSPCVCEKFICHFSLLLLEVFPQGTQPCVCGSR